MVSITSNGIWTYLRTAFPGWFVQCGVATVNEVLEHLPYAPWLLFKEIRRVLLPQGKLYLTTPNPGALSKLIRLALGLNNEPHLDVFWDEDDAYTYKGLTFFKSMRETRIWTIGELIEVLPKYGLKVVYYSYYGNTLGGGRYLTRCKKLCFKLLNALIRPVVKRTTAGILDADA